MGRANAERMPSKMVLCRPCRENNHSECLMHYERCDCSLCVMLRDVARMEDDAAQHDRFKNVSDDDAHNPG
jgi:hypothetical protein